MAAISGAVLTLDNSEHSLGLGGMGAGRSRARMGHRAAPALLMLRLRRQPKFSRSQSLVADFQARWRHLSGTELPAQCRPQLLGHGLFFIIFHIQLDLESDDGKSLSTLLTRPKA